MMIAMKKVKNTELARKTKTDWQIGFCGYFAIGVLVFPVVLFCMIYTSPAYYFHGNPIHIQSSAEILPAVPIFSLPPRSSVPAAPDPPVYMHSAVATISNSCREWRKLEHASYPFPFSPANSRQVRSTSGSAQPAQQLMSKEFLRNYAICTAIGKTSGKPTGQSIVYELWIFLAALWTLKLLYKMVKLIYKMANLCFFRSKAYIGYRIQIRRRKIWVRKMFFDKIYDLGDENLH